MVNTIGKCIGCDRPARLDEGVCQDCLKSPNRGRRWAHLANQCRNDAEFAKKVYDKIPSQDGKKLFMLIFNYLDHPDFRIEKNPTHLHLV